MRSIKFVGVLVTCALSLALGSGNSASGADEAAAGNGQKINVGLQLYSFRAQMAKDVPGTLELAHKMGITDVEIAGVYGLSAERLRDELKKHDLKPSGMHFQWPQLSEHLDQVIADAKTLGLEYVTLPWIPHNGEFTPKDAQKAVAAFNKWGKQLAEAGLMFTYHPHGYEFRPQADGRSLFDMMVKETDPKYVNYEIDIFWAYDGGADPVKLMQKYPDRFPLMHLKDMRKDIKTPNYTGHEDVEADVALGKGQLDIPAILNEAIKIGVKHYYIEDESKESVQQVPVSIAYVRSIGH
jgi:sugar phosphate isomerase/epimerase